MQQVCMHYGILGATNSSRDVTDLECYHKASRNQHQLRQPAVAKTNFATQFISKSSLTYPLYVLLACKSQMYTLSLTSSMPPIQASSTQSSSTINVIELILYAARSNLVQTKLDNPLLHQIIQCCKNCNPSRKKNTSQIGNCENLFESQVLWSLSGESMHSNNRVTCTSALQSKPTARTFSYSSAIAGWQDYMLAETTKSVEFASWLAFGQSCAIDMDVVTLSANERVYNLGLLSICNQCQL